MRPIVSQAIPDMFVAQKTLEFTPQSPGERRQGRDFSCCLPVLPTRVCNTETLSDSSNYHCCLSNLQGFLNTVELLETERLGVAWGLLKYIKKRSIHFVGTDRRSVLEGRMQAPLSRLSLQTEERPPDSAIFHCSCFSAPHYFKNCVCKHLIQLSIQTRMIYTHLLCIWCIYVPEMLFKLNCSVKAALIWTLATTSGSQTNSYIISSRPGWGRKLF